MKETWRTLTPTMERRGNREAWYNNIRKEKNVPRGIGKHETIANMSMGIGKLKN